MGASVRALAVALVAASLVACAPGATGPAGPGTAASPALGLWMPVHGVRVADVVGNFGAPRGDRVHEGVDIFAARGTPVLSAGTGTVRFVGRTARGGWTVWVEHHGLDVWYAHLDAVAPDLRPQQRVTSETLIGYVGNTGNARGGPPHLHFEIATASGPIDPLPHLRDRR